ncbi:MAG: metallophosphoesterase [Pseudomonadota bacterium]
MTELTFAHLTDLHLPILTAPSPSSLMNKRALGYLSWKRKRSARHRLEALNAVAADMRAMRPRAAFITGDLVNIALPAEFRDAKRWADEALAGTETVFVPGNHDAYVRAPWQDGLGHLSEFMVGARTNEERPRPPEGPDDFPFVRRFPLEGGTGGVSVIAANSSPPTAPGLASGALGPAQIGRIETELRTAGARRDFRILMLHHPVTDGAVSTRKALNDRRDLRDAIARVGADLVLHGHAHVSHVGEVDTPVGAAPVLGGASASHASAEGPYRPARYNLIALHRRPDDWAITVKVRELDPASGAVGAAETLQFRRPAL